ncbi:MAG: hypothetical protein LBJ47_07655 [Tannerella sp.]|nr:hypothetical protein [Tannerella sp.]
MADVTRQTVTHSMLRHCDPPSVTSERSEAIRIVACTWIASSFLLAMTSLHAPSPANAVKQSRHRRYKPGRLSGGRLCRDCFVPRG